jgi:hypothetical protein
MPPGAKRAKLESDESGALQEINMNAGADLDKQDPPKRPRLDTTPIINFFTEIEKFQKIQAVLGLQNDQRFCTIF